VFDVLHRRHKATNAMLHAFDLLELYGYMLLDRGMAKVAFAVFEATMAKLRSRTSSMTLPVRPRRPKR
jgi:hypothetical protein